MIAVVGLGRWGHHHVEQLCEIVGGADVVGVDPMPDRRAAIEAIGIRCVPDVESLTTSIAGAVVATSPETHAEVAIDLLERGVPVLVEKPLATTPDDAWRVVEVAEAQGLPLVVGHIFLFQSAHDRLREHAQKLGRLRFLAVQRRAPGSTGSAVEAWDDLVHNELAVALDLGAAASGIEETDVQSWYSAGDAEGVVTRLRGEDGAIEIRCSCASPIRWREVWLVGERGQALQVDGLGVRRVALWTADTPAGSPGEPTWEEVSGPPPLRRELETFLDAIERGGEVRSGGPLGARVVEIMARAGAPTLNAVRG